MIKNINQGIIAPIVSICILVFGSGLYVTLTSLQLKSLSVSDWQVGLISGLFWLGFLIGAYYTQYLVLKVGHIRAYTALAAVFIICILLQGNTKYSWVWYILRFMGGFSISGCLLVIESWLLGSSNRKNRGLILAIYMLSYYCTQGFSNLLLGMHGTSKDHILYLFMAIFATLSIIPVSVTRFHAPRPEYPETLPLQDVYKKVPVGFWGCIVSGIILASIYNLYSIYLQANHYSPKQISYFILAIFIGATIAQYPVGRLSDYLDRRKVLWGAYSATIVICLLILFFNKSLIILLILSILLGGSTFTIYPLAINHAIDHYKSSQIISATSTLCVAFGLGTCLGPPIISIFMDYFGDMALLFAIMILSLWVMLFILYYIWKSPPLELSKQSGAHMMPRTTPEVVQLDPIVSQAQINARHQPNMND